MAYTVLARRYRSDSFKDVVGQEPIARTLCNAIRKQRVAHAYLFTGTRGVGKTSMARLMARALNAPDTLADTLTCDDGHVYPAEDVQQRMAAAIMRGEDMNVIEIDGASTRGVEDARQLIANASLAPTGNARYKIYIIDEVHQLTKDAFNTLLKTMEEPPSHVKFVLCTTEPHKVPATIQSRCQRFDFRNISTAAIAGHLDAVLDKEKVEAEAALVQHVARLGNGSMRDALSLLDRLIATGEQPLTTVTLERMLGLPPREGVVKLIDALAEGDVAAALACVDEMLNSGTAQEQIIAALTDRLHTLMLLAACGEKTSLVDLPDDARADAAQQAGRFDAAGLSHMIALCEGLARSSRSSSAPRAMLDATVVRLALAEKMADVTALLSGVPATHAAASAGSTSGSTAGPSKKKVGEPAGGLAGGQASGQSGTDAKAAVARDLTERRQGRAQGGPDGPVSRTDAARAPTTHAPTTGEPVSAAGAPAETAAPEMSAQALSAPDVWARLVARHSGKASTSAWLGALELLSLEDGVARLRPRPGRRDVMRLMTDARRAQLGQMLSEVTGHRWRMELAADDPKTMALDGADPGEGDRNGAAGDRQAALELPLVRQIMDQFEVTLMAVRRERPTALDAENADVPRELTEGNEEAS